MLYRESGFVYNKNMISRSLEEAMAFAKEHGIPRVIEMSCPRPSCGKTLYAVTDGDDREHKAWLKELQLKAMRRFIYCKYCGYGSASDTQGHFVFKTHKVF